MAIQTYRKTQIAKVQLLTALKLYLDGSDYISAITLAGASEEILGKCLAGLKTENALQQRVRTAALIAKHILNHETTEKKIADVCNRARNAVKHLNAGCASGELTVAFDSKMSAEEMLERAIENLDRVDPFEYTAEIQEFNRKILN